MNQVLILAISIVIPSTALVLVARQYFTYQQRKVEVNTAQTAAYRELADRSDRHNADVAEQLRQLTARLERIEAVLHSVG